MWLQRFTSYILRHSWQTFLLTFAVTFVPVVGGTISILIATFITLHKGVKEGALLTIAASIPYFVSFNLSSSQEVPLIALWMVVGVATVSNILTWCFAVMLRDKASFSSILQVAALFGVLVISVLHLAYPNISDWWAVQLQTYADQAQKMTAMLKPSGIAAQESVQLDARIEWISVVKYYASGFIAAIILLNAVIQLIVARWWQVVIYKPGTLQKELHSIRLSRLAGLLFVLSLVLSYLGNSVVLDIMPILYVLFGAAGLSLIHYLFGLMNSPTKWFWLALLYVTLVFAMPMSLMLVAIFALFDISFNLRKRFKKA